MSVDNPSAPVKNARHAERSMVFSADDELGRPSPKLIELAIKSITAAQTIDLASISNRMSGPPYYPEIWPGEHYRLLAAIVQILEPRRVVEIGTATGLSALAMKSRLPAESRLISFDIIPWREFPGCVLRDEDFVDDTLLQKVADISNPEVFEQFAQQLSLADIVFIDAAKDVVTEKRLIENFRSLSFVKPPLFIFDDIRLWNMLGIWRDLAAPKLDLTSFGHWSGTGLVEWSWEK